MFLVDCGIGSGHLVCEWIMVATQGVDNESEKRECGENVPGGCRESSEKSRSVFSQPQT